MRVLLTTESYLPYVSGVTVSVDAVARGLGARGHEVMVLAPRPADDAPLDDVGSPGPAPRHAWLTSYQLPGVAPPGYRMPLPPLAPTGDDAVRNAVRFAPDVIHANSPFVTGLLAWRLARRLDRPLVFTHHTRFDDYGHYLGPLRGPGSAFVAAYLRRWWLACAGIVAPSSDMAAEIRRRLPRRARSRVAVIPTGVDVEGIRARPAADPRPEAGWPPEAVVAVTLGRLAPEKSPEVVLRAFALAAAQQPALRLLVIGGGPLEGSLRRTAAEMGLAGRVHLTGRLPRPVALGLLAGSDLFAFASRTETQGLVLAEALAAGLPVLAVDAWGVADSVRDGVDGLVVAADPPDRRPRRLAAAMSALAADFERREALSRRAREDAERFGIERRAAQLEGLYRRLGA